MLNSLRTFSNNSFGKIIMALIMGFIIFSFGIWGIADIFRGFGTGQLAKVGKTEITAENFRNAFERERLGLQQRFQRVISADEAHKLGLDQVVLSRLIADTALDQKAKALSLGISDQSVATSISNDPSFKGPKGFDKDRFTAVLRNFGYTEAGYVADQKKAVLRREIGSAIAAELPVPKTMLEAYNAYGNEERSVDYVTLTPAALGTLAPPDEAALKTFFEARKSEFRAPEYRKITMLNISPATLAKPDSVSDADAQALYDKVKDKRFVTPETRALEQILYSNLDDAKAALEKARSGTAFATLAQERNLKSSDIDLGLKQKADLADSAVAEAGFALALDAVSEPVKTPFGYTLVHARKINPEIVKSFADMAATLKQELALERAKTDVQTLRDKIEDQRTSGKPLTEAAKAAGLDTVTVEAIDSTGLDKSGKPVLSMADPIPFMKAVFASDVGLDNDTLLNKDGGYSWFEIQKIEPARDRSLDEVKDRVTAAWTEAETTRKLSEMAAEGVKKLTSGTSLNDLAVGWGNLAIKSASGITRNGKSDLPQNFVLQIFNQPVDGAGSVGLVDGNRAVFHLTGSKVPALDPASPQAKQLEQQLKAALSNDILAEYITKLQSELGVRVNDQARAQIMGN